MSRDFGFDLENNVTTDWTCSREGFVYTLTSGAQNIIYCPGCGQKAKEG